MLVRFGAALAAMTSAVLGAGCFGSADSTQQNAATAAGNAATHDKGSGSATAAYKITTLVTDETDPDLVNPWGIVGGEGVFWIADNGTGKLSIYDGDGKPSEEYPTGQFTLGEGITGVARVESDAGDASDAFLIDTGDDCPTPAEFIFAREDGKLIAINDDAPRTGVVVVDRSAEGAIYLGVAVIESSHGPRLLAADFKNRRIDVFDDKFQLVTTMTGNLPFVDQSAPDDFGPFNVIAIDDNVYVTYAKESDEPGEEEAGPGLGQVAIFDAEGRMQRHIKSELFNAPWGVAVGDLVVCDQSAHALLVGNFGDGHITAFDTPSLRPLGQLSGTDGKPLAIDGLWGIAMGGDEAGAEGALYFVAGPEEETKGLYGRIDRVEP